MSFKSKSIQIQILVNAKNTIMHFWYHTMYFEQFTIHVSCDLIVEHHKSIIFLKGKYNIHMEFLFYLKMQ